MIGLSTISSTDTNELNIHIPDEMKGVALRIIILPANNDDAEIDFFTEAELGYLPKINLGSSVNDKEDYSKW